MFCQKDHKQIPIERKKAHRKYFSEVFNSPKKPVIDLRVFLETLRISASLVEFRVLPSRSAVSSDLTIGGDLAIGVLQLVQ
jgi:hypothetical protein